MLAILRTSGRQFEVREGESIKVNYIKQKVGDTIRFDNILLIRCDKNNISFPSGYADVTVEAHRKEKKIIVFKKKRRKGYKKKQGHKQKITFLKVKSIREKDGN